MSIHGIGGGQSPGRPDQVGNRKIDEASSKNDRSTAVGGDRIELSPEARQILRLTEKTQQLPEVREDRVEELRQQLAEGTYKVDPQQIAAAILEEDGAF